LDTIKHYTQFITKDEDEDEDQQEPTSPKTEGGATTERELH
jgi:hypothetical protein